jgi:hypothetical protein
MNRSVVVRLLAWVPGDAGPLMEWQAMLRPGRAAPGHTPRGSAAWAPRAAAMGCGDRVLLVTMMRRVGASGQVVSIGSETGPQIGAE